MPRDIPVGNGTLLVNFDQDYCLRDIYFPHVGKENQTDGRKCRLGFWVDGGFRWMDRGWSPSLRYREDSLVTDVKASSAELALEFRCSDLVDYKENMFIRRMVVRNLAGRARECRVFLHHDFNIRESSAANTAYYDPDEKAVIHYRENRYFLVSGMREGRLGPDQYATGLKEFRAWEGTWKDAEDGILSGNPIVQGSVDSVVAFTLALPAGGEQYLDCWICAGRDYSGVSRLNRMLSGHGIDHFARRTENYWRAWVGKENTDLSRLSPAVRSLYKKSLLILQTNIDAGGAIVAGTDSDIAHSFTRDTYGYVWPRDGALTAYAVDMAGYPGLSRSFFEFCFRIISRGKESVGGYFLHKYNPDGSLGSSWQPWVSGQDKILPIQEDSTALVIWALWRHFERYRDIELVVNLYEQLILRCGDFLASYRDDSTGLPLPSYDLWEEKWGVHSYTVAAVYAGIKAAESFAAFFRDAKRQRIYRRAALEVRQAMENRLCGGVPTRFLKSIVFREDGLLDRDMAVDASAYAAFYFGAFHPRDARVANTMRAIRDALGVPGAAGGIARYENDPYQFGGSPAGARLPGNPWFLCTLWLAQWHIAGAESMHDLTAAADILEWTASRSLPSGVLAEQLDPATGRPLSVSPLTWSQATLVAAVLEYASKAEMLSPRHRERMYA